jgi:hypothetical protein
VWQDALQTRFAVMNDYFEALGRTVLERWREQNFSLEVFPELSRRAMQEAPPSDNVDVEQMIREFLLCDEQVFQSDSGFGQPELIVFHDTRFYIQILFWLEGTTEVHQHEFSGAFHVMQGSSVHSEFAFTGARAVTPHICIGDLEVKHIELLEKGRSIPIISGAGHIHSLFHLDTPSITVVIRTHHDPGTGPQYNYLPPHIAINPLHADTLTTRRKQLLDVLEAVNDPSYAILVQEMIEQLDFERGFHTLRHAMPRLIELDEWETILDIFQRTHGELAVGVADTLAECLRRETISQLRHYIFQPEHRFFLALLVNVQHREAIDSLIAQRFPDSEPIEMILSWAEEMIEWRDFGIALLDAVFPESLGIELEEQTSLLLGALRQALENEGQESSSEDIIEIQAALRASCLKPLFC